MAENYVEEALVGLLVSKLLADEDVFEILFGVCHPEALVLRVGYAVRDDRGLIVLCYHFYEFCCTWEHEASISEEYRVILSCIDGIVREVHAFEEHPEACALQLIYSHLPSLEHVPADIILMVVDIYVFRSVGDVQ